VVLLRDLLKRCCLAVCSIFNDTIKLDGLVFCWSLINTFKDLRRINLWRLLLNTVLMWGAYLASYAVLGQAITLPAAALAAALAWWKCSTCCSASRAWM
jgi:hypothetical protein